jgi:uncharacterized protein with HEPN domain
MNLKSLRIPDFLLHILEATQRIQTYTNGMQEQEFLTNQLVQDAVIRNIEIMGEASRNIEMLDPQFASKYPQLPLRKIYLMRNQLIHGYVTVNANLVWTTICRDIPILRAAVQQVYDSLPQ